MDFEITIEYLKSYPETPIAVECLNSMLNQEILYNEGIRQEKQKLTSLYSLRLNIAKDLHKNIYKKEELENWENAIKDLKKSNCEKLLLNTIITERKIFFLFWDALSIKLEAIYYLNSKLSILDQELYNDNIVKKGLSVSSVKYKNGHRVKDWKQ